MLEEKAVSSGSMDDTTYLNGFDFYNIEHEVLVNDEHSIAEPPQPFIPGSYAKKWVES